MAFWRHHRDLTWDASGKLNTYQGLSRQFSPRDAPIDATDTLVGSEPTATLEVAASWADTKSLFPQDPYDGRGPIQTDDPLVVEVVEVVEALDASRTGNIPVLYRVVAALEFRSMRSGAYDAPEIVTVQAPDPVYAPELFLRVVRVPTPRVDVSNLLLRLVTRYSRA